MRKKLWTCAVAVAVLAVSGGLAVDYACYHPDSFLGRWLFKTQPITAFPMGPLRIAGQAAVVTAQGVQGLFGQGTTAVWDHDPNRPPQTRPCDEGCPMEPALLPGAVVLQVEPDDLPAQPMPSVREVGSGRGGAEACEEARMPAVEDNTAVMPRVEDDFGPETPPAPQNTNGPGIKHPSINTMEVRLSDLWFLDFLGPF